MNAVATALFRLAARAAILGAIGVLLCTLASGVQLDLFQISPDVSLVALGAFVIIEGALLVVMERLLGTVG